MKKFIKIFLIIIVIILLSVIIDLICIFTINRPIFAVKDDCDCVYAVYRGLFYDTYNCPEYSIPQIKAKGTKFSCTISRFDIGDIIDIVDTTKDIKDFACAEALEEFYSDDNHTYYWNCIKNKYMIVKYESGFEETISSALKNGTIDISDLDRYGINYIKDENYSIKSNVIR
jgi:hypothetical protein